MSSNSKIEWTEATWNPIIGCSKCSPGCLNCYAERMAHRLGQIKATPQYAGLTACGMWTGETRFNREVSSPWRWKKPRRIFVCSMGDLFHESLEHHQIHAVLDIMHHAPQHTYILLTKRPARMKEVLASYPLPSASCKNWWFGATVCNQEEADEKIPVLLSIPAAVRWVSVEPMLGPIDLSRYLGFQHEDELEIENVMPQPDPWAALGMPMHDPWIRGLDWVVCGGETGPGARPMDPTWARSLRDQCHRAGTPFFFKKLGYKRETPEDLDVREYPGVKG